MLLRTLLQLTLLTPEIADHERSRQVLCAATDHQWREAMKDLKLHRLLPLVFHGLKTCHVTDCLPKSVSSQLLTAYVYSSQRNTILLRTLAKVLEPMYAANIYPILWKGVVLADQIYPDIATRMIGDIDWAIAPQDLPLVSRLFSQMEFELKPEMTTSDAVYFKNISAVVFDVHHRVRLFEGKEHLPLTMNVVPQLSGLPTLHVLEPNAMLTHLTVHLAGHASDTGLMLFWILDFLFLLRRWGHKIELDRLNLLMPDAQSWCLLGRVLRFLQVEFQTPLPPELAALAQHYHPFTLESVVRQRRLAMLDLHRPKGWLRLIARRLKIQSPQTLEPPQAGRLLWTPHAITMGDRPCL